jgi:hypothetical protein
MVVSAWRRVSFVLRQAEDIWLVIPLTLRKRNGRSKILPPKDVGLPGSLSRHPHVLRAIARAWKWRRQLEEGEASTLQDMAGKEGVSERFIGRMIRLAYLAPAVLEALVVKRRAPAIPINEMVEVAKLPWGEQMGHVFHERSLTHRRHSARRLLVPLHSPSRHKHQCDYCY